MLFKYKCQFMVTGVVQDSEIHVHSRSFEQAKLIFLLQLNSWNKRSGTHKYWGVFTDTESLEKQKVRSIENDG